MPQFILSILAVIRVFFRRRSDTALEVLALRQLVAVLNCKRPRPTSNSVDRFFWTTLCRFWSRRSHVLVIVKPLQAWTLEHDPNDTVAGCCQSWGT